MVIENPQRFPRILLVEGRPRYLDRQGARRYARGGGLRVLFACGRASCRASAERAAVQLKGGRVPSRVVYAAEQGHTYDGGVQTAIAAALPWLLSDDLAAQPGCDRLAQPANASGALGQCRISDGLLCCYSDQAGRPQPPRPTLEEFPC